LIVATAGRATLTSLTATDVLWKKTSSLARVCCEQVEAGLGIKATS